MASVLMRYLNQTSLLPQLHRLKVTCNRLIPVTTSAIQPVKLKSSKSKNKTEEKKLLSSIVKPVPVMPQTGGNNTNVGVELVGTLDTAKMKQVMTKFYGRNEVKMLALENGLDNILFNKVNVSFRRFCLTSKNLPTELHIILSDIIHGSGHVDDLFPYFLEHARDMFPHLYCKEDLEKISDLTVPANWYPEARAIKRKIIYHAGPTNSGKTYHALKSFTSAVSGVYCGPLRMLANEVHRKTNEAGTPCDLITGEEWKFVSEDGTPANHVSCTVEMSSITTPYSVGVIDEIQMIRDSNRGWAWTRALLGLCAKEIHVCGEASAIDFLNEIALYTGDDVEVKHYERLTKLMFRDKAIGNMKNVEPGDCIVCFSKADVYKVSQEVEKQKKEVAVIYGTLPADVKRQQAERFNDPNDPCKVLVATDAIGMGINLNINRIIFYSLIKTMVVDGERHFGVISPAAALQIAGRAGRYKSTYHDGGTVTTYKQKDLAVLKELLTTDIKSVVKAGLYPNPDHIELFSYHLPKTTLPNIIEIFVSLCTLDNDMYFLCDMDDFKYLAEMIEHVPLSLRARYVFCCAPIQKKDSFVCTMFLKFARHFSKSDPVTVRWLKNHLEWPYKVPILISELTHLEGVFDVLDLYLWLSKRFPEIFPYTDDVKAMQEELNHTIYTAVVKITQLKLNDEETLENTEEDIVNSDNNESFSHSRTKKSKETGISPKSEEETLSFHRTIQTQSQINNQTAFNSVRELQDKDTGVEDSYSSQLVKEGVLTKEMLAKVMEELNSKKNGE